MLIVRASLYMLQNPLISEKYPSILFFGRR